MEVKKCPRCNFPLTDNKYCIKCGYRINNLEDSSNNIQKDVNELELALGDDYQKILHGQNSILIFLLGPLYILYRNIYLGGLFLYIIDISMRVYISVVLNATLDKYRLGIPHELDFVIIFWFLVRIVYVIFGDIIVILLTKLKIFILKKIFKNKYKSILKYSLPKVIRIIFVIILFWLQILFWEYKYLLGI